MAAGMDVREVITYKATITAATARTMKLYGQMIPNTKSGGCNGDLCTESEKKKVNPADFSTGFIFCNS